MTAVEAVGAAAAAELAAAVEPAAAAVEAAVENLYVAGCSKRPLRHCWRC